MDQVSLVKADVRKSQWTEIIQACQSSGMTVKAWCLENGINIKSYYYRLRKLREELCNSAQQAVPVCSVSSSHFVVIRLSTDNLCVLWYNEHRNGGKP